MIRCDPGAPVADREAEGTRPTASTRATPRDCSVAAALEVIGDRWSLLAVRELSLGVTRFNDVVANTGAPRDILTARLRKLEEQGVVRREAYSDRPPRLDYLLTEAGVALAPEAASPSHPPYR